METNYFESVNQVAGSGPTKGCRIIQFRQRSADTVDVIEPWQMSFRGEANAEDHIATFGPLRRIRICFAGQSGSVRMGVEPMREAASSRASVGREEAIDPFLWNVVDLIGIAAIDEVRLAEELTLAGEETVGVVSAGIGLDYVFRVGSLVVGIHADENLVGQGLEGPVEDSGEGLDWHKQNRGVGVAVQA